MQLIKAEYFHWPMQKQDRDHDPSDCKDAVEEDDDAVEEDDDT